MVAIGAPKEAEDANKKQEELWDAAKKQDEEAESQCGCPSTVVKMSLQPQLACTGHTHSDDTRHTGRATLSTARMLGADCRGAQSGANCGSPRLKATR